MVDTIPLAIVILLPLFLWTIHIVIQFDSWNQKKFESVTTFDKVRLTKWLVCKYLSQSTKCFDIRWRYKDTTIASQKPAERQKRNRGKRGGRQFREREQRRRLEAEECREQYRPEANRASSRPPSRSLNNDPNPLPLLVFHFLTPWKIFFLNKFHY
ncbi:hypothetical protein K492DRAFT_194371 [Lichtheimia hyalospora FSU 10163]|nr:hypothetical protein K492DRAFT_194371 [Lichtheimia hyalospora FSU 10163]